ncbi:MAG: UTP--glucose-1-phosphate uridylyltransferase [Candidatus Lloydbacteria bacterium RIFCSPLOWO2_01_FULL_50_20]|uniref:UTP--glucose-1-phosphate uridylyltransferase n=1 Tax=Candidatus Lloydbacteria bacterium RIFCSPLOWO2_01_FULL_50_20 TaxID=1798665 RepID=A0A1G2DCL2_9BACT|nr:MAG: UTP--glucose-1-phosphate uridylyltransferase [Candidatus Lloydbacteria bacterium RIFCSPHIGHO2_02_FULL_50_11]OGZ11385.1 MAG: UTP--glucose-1-phosphate uridylyltransferase [Candidatus Lloydbacteria bacterium RIFCSPLOWO2_01_FULL_50_20]
MKNSPTKIRKAVIAVAGSGTRFLPATKAQPKEMLPIVDKPIVQYVVEEMVASGITDIILVTKWDKKTLEDHFDRSFELEYALEQAGKKKLLDDVRRISTMANFIYVRQKGPYGNGTPILSAANLVEGEPFVFAWGDDLVLSKKPFTKSLIENFEKNGSPVIGVQAVPREHVDRYGIVKLRPGTKEMELVVEKPAVGKAPSRLAQFGRMVLTPEIVEILKRTKLGKGGELWVTDAISEYVRGGGRFMVEEVKDGEWLTTGDPLNYLKAVVEYALKRDDIGPGFRSYLKSLSI